MIKYSRIILEKINNKNFSLPPQLNQKDYKIVGDLSNVRNWKARILVGNSLTSNKKIGDFDDVCYVFIDINNNYIIPIARSDEHKLGYELLNFLKRKYKIKGEYVSVCATSTNYIYSSKQSLLEQYKKAFEKFLEYGGDPLIMVNIKDENGREYFLTISEFIKNNGQPTYVNKQLSEYGEKIISYLEKIAKLYNKKDKNLFSIAFNFVDKFFSKIEFVLYILDKDSNLVDQEEEIKKQILTAEVDEDFETIGKLFFSFNGIKNSIHNNIRKAINNPNDYFLSKTILLWGDIKKANQEFNRLSNI